MCILTAISSASPEPMPACAVRGGLTEAVRCTIAPPPLCVVVDALIINTRPEIRRDYPLNLSILVSGGKETNQDSLSNGE